MKILKIVFVLAAVALAGVAFAGSPQTDDGREEALSFCQGFNFSSYTDRCMGVVHQARYFDVRAIGLCGTLGFDTGKLQCVQVIGNKTYLDGEIAICGKEQFDDNRVSCLARGGEGYIPNNGCMIDVPSIENRLVSGLNALRAGDPASADQAIVDVLNYLGARNVSRP